MEKEPRPQQEEVKKLDEVAKEFPWLNNVDFITWEDEVGQTEFILRNITFEDRNAQIISNFAEKMLRREHGKTYIFFDSQGEWIGDSMGKNMEAELQGRRETHFHQEGPVAFIILDLERNLDDPSRVILYKVSYARK